MVDSPLLCVCSEGVEGEGASRPGFKFELGMLNLDRGLQAMTYQSLVVAPDGVPGETSPQTPRVWGRA